MASSAMAPYIVGNRSSRQVAISAVADRATVSSTPVGLKNGLNTLRRPSVPRICASTGRHVTNDVDSSDTPPPAYDTTRLARASTPFSRDAPTACTCDGAPRTEEANEIG